MALSKCHIGISPSGQKMGLWDQSQCHVQSIVGIDPNVMKKRVLGSVPMSCTGCNWDWSHSNEKQDFWISPKFLNMICGNLDNSQTSFILTLGQIPVLYILGFWDKSQNYQRNSSGIGGLTTVDCLVSVPILPKMRVWDKSQPIQKQEFGISPNFPKARLWDKSQNFHKWGFGINPFIYCQAWGPGITLSMSFVKFN